MVCMVMADIASSYMNLFYWDINCPITQIGGRVGHVSNEFLLTRRSREKMVNLLPAIFKLFTFLYDHYFILMNISLHFIPRGSFNNRAAMLER